MRVPKNFLTYLQMHEACPRLSIVKAVAMTALEVEMSNDPEIIRMRRMVYDVILEIHRMRGFVRLKFFGPHILYGFLKPRHRTGSHICKIFAKRAPGNLIVLGNEVESWISIFMSSKIFCHHGQGLTKALREIESVLGSSLKENGVEEIGKIYYDSQYCPDRKNLAAFRRRMPIKAIDSAGLKLEMNNNCFTLDDFFCRD